MRVTVAGDEDLEIVSSILLEASCWLDARGMGLWREEELVPAALRRDRGTAWHLVWCEDAPAGTFSLQWHDPLFWPEVPPDESAFLHKIAVRRAFAGRGVPQHVVAWAVDTARARNARSVRLDCAAGQPKPQAVYERLGFQFVGCRLVGTFDTALYELTLPPEPARQKS